MCTGNREDSQSISKSARASQSISKCTEIGPDAYKVGPVPIYKAAQVEGAREPQAAAAASAARLCARSGTAEWCPVAQPHVEALLAQQPSIEGCSSRSGGHTSHTCALTAGAHSVT